MGIEQMAPLSVRRIEQALTDIGVQVLPPRKERRDVAAVFDLDQEQVQVVVSIQRGRVLCVDAASAREVPPDREELLLGRVNRWNSLYRWPTACLYLTSGLVNGHVSVDCPGGLDDQALQGACRRLIGMVLRFVGWLSEQERRDLGARGPADDSGGSLGLDWFRMLGVNGPDKGGLTG